MAEDKKEQKEKPLDRMTVKELKDIALEIPDITGVHGMNKTELLSAIKQAKGIVDETKKRKGGSNRELKKRIQELKAERESALQANDKKRAGIHRKKISRLKKRTRKAA